ncbi:MAG: helix-turn-helix domain-containing protein [Polyangia bacterium]
MSAGSRQAKQAIAQDRSDKPAYVAFARLLRERRASRTITAKKLADMARLSCSTVRNLETARVIPLRQTLEILRNIELRICH